MRGGIVVTGGRAAAVAGGRSYELDEFGDSVGRAARSALSTSAEAAVGASPITVPPLLRRGSRACGRGSGTFSGARAGASNASAVSTQTPVTLQSAGAEVAVPARRWHSRGQRMTTGERQSRRKWLVPWWRLRRAIRAVLVVAALAVVTVASAVARLGPVMAQAGEPGRARQRVLTGCVASCGLADGLWWCRR